MKPEPTSAAPPAASPLALREALEKSHEVKEKVEACADDLAASNDQVKQKLLDGVTTLPAEAALHEGEVVEAKVQECADDLAAVNDTLAQGLQVLEGVEAALTRSRTALAQSEAALATAQAEEKKATQRAMHDALTGLPNRGLFDDRLDHGIALAERHQWSLAVLFLDLDRFKRINDEHGHAVGDLVLKEVARRLLQCARDEDSVCRNGGDEFLYLLVNPKARADVERVVAKVSSHLARPMKFAGLELVVGCSIGIAVYPADGTTGRPLVEHADAAMYRAKRLAQQVASAS